MTQDWARRIEQVVIDADFVNAETSPHSPETDALADADTIFKILPVTPILFTSNWLNESGVNLCDLAAGIMEIQHSRFLQGRLFRTRYARITYSEWAEVNFQLWAAVRDFGSSDDAKAILDLRGGLLDGA
jgi:hypothetical protein